MQREMKLRTVEVAGELKVRRTPARLNHRKSEIDSVLITNDNPPNSGDAIGIRFKVVSHGQGAAATTQALPFEGPLPAAVTLNPGQSVGFAISRPGDIAFDTTLGNADPGDHEDIHVGC